MTITIFYEIICDNCGSAEYFPGTKKYAESYYRKTGGIITYDKKYYCNKKCYDQKIIKEKESEDV